MISYYTAISSLPPYLKKASLTDLATKKRYRIPCSKTKPSEIDRQIVQPKGGSKMSFQVKTDALDPTYTPSNDAEREKFEDDKTFISTVLGRVMKEAAGEDILRDNVDDTTVTWPLIVKTYTMGPKASVQARKSTRSWPQLLSLRTPRHKEVFPLRPDLSNLLR